MSADTRARTATRRQLEDALSLVVPPDRHPTVMSQAPRASTSTEVLVGLVERAEELRTLFSRAGTSGEIELYPGVHHGFAFPQRWCYDKRAAEQHWERLIALYRRRLG